MIDLCYGDESLQGSEFRNLFTAIWPSAVESSEFSKAIESTLNVTARESGRLIGCLRILSDGSLMSVICEIIVHPEFRDEGSARALLELVTSEHHGNLLLAMHKVDRTYMKAIGWQEGHVAFVLHKA